MAQDNIETGKEALSRRGYPWYDVESDGVKKVEFRARPDARSSDRANIPLAPLKKKAANPRGFNTNWSGLFEGISYFVWGLMAVGLALIVGLLVWAFFRLETNTPDDDEGASRRSMAESIKQLPFDLESETGDFQQLAKASYSKGDYRKAIIYLFSHVSGFA